MALSLTLDPDLQARHAVIAQVLDAYRHIADGAGIPPWSRFSPTAMPARVLPYLLVVEVAAGDPPRFAWRLIGTAIVNRLGRDSTGRSFESLYQGEAYDHMTAAPLWVLAHGRPLRSLGGAAFAGKDFLASENLFMPFSTTGDDRIDRILAASVYESPSEGRLADRSGPLA